MTGRPDFIAGNTRLRARMPALAGHVELRSDQADSADGDEVQNAVTRRLRNLMRDVRGLYHGAAEEVVGVLLARHDLCDVLALLRGARTGQPAPARLAAVMAVGVLDDRAAADVAAAADGSTAVTRLAAHRLPDRATARTLQAAWSRFELTADPDELEVTVTSTAIDGWTDLLGRAGSAARPVLALVLAECDRANLLAVLRDGTGEVPCLLPAGLLCPRALLAAHRGDMAPVLAERAIWRAALNRYSSDGDITALEWSLDESIWRPAVRALRRGDPLSADVPVGYVLAAEREARNERLRLLAARRGPENGARDELVA